MGLLDIWIILDGVLRLAPNEKVKDVEPLGDVLTEPPLHWIRNDSEKCLEPLGDWAKPDEIIPRWSFCSF